AATARPSTNSSTSTVSSSRRGMYESSGTPTRTCTSRPSGSDAVCSTGRPRRLTAELLPSRGRLKRPSPAPSWPCDPGAPPGAPGPIPAADGPVDPLHDHRGRNRPRGDLDLQARPDLDPDLGLPRARAQPGGGVVHATRDTPPRLGGGAYLPAHDRVLRRNRLHDRPDPRRPAQRVRPQAPELRPRHHARTRPARLPRDEVPHP